MNIKDAKIRLVKIFTETKPYTLVKHLTEDDKNAIRYIFWEALFKSLELGIKYGRDVVVVSLHSIRCDFLMNTISNKKDLVLPVIIDLLQESKIPFNIHEDSVIGYCDFEFKMEDLKKFTNVDVLGILS